MNNIKKLQNNDPQNLGLFFRLSPEDSSSTSSSGDSVRAKSPIGRPIGRPPPQIATRSTIGRSPPEIAMDTLTPTPYPRTPSRSFQVLKNIVQL
jgi:hypothetical protein